MPKQHGHLALIMHGVAYTLIAELVIWLLRRMYLKKKPEKIET